MKVAMCGSAITYQCACDTSVDKHRWPQKSHTTNATLLVYQVYTNIRRLRDDLTTYKPDLCALVPLILDTLQKRVSLVKCILQSTCT